MSQGVKKIGDAFVPVEDHRFTWGHGRYADNFNHQDQCYAVFVRSPHAHAKIVSIDTSEAQSMPGVVTVLSAKEIREDTPEAFPQFGNVPCGWQVTGRNGEVMKEAPHLMLAEDKVRYHGDQVAVVIAESIEQAKKAAKKVQVTYEKLPAVMLQNGSQDGHTYVHEMFASNEVFDWEIGDEKATQEALDNADEVVELSVVNNRLAANPIEPRCALAAYDPVTGNYDLHVTTQNPHVHRLLICAFVLGIPEHKLHVQSHDVGGAFGSKIFIYPEECVLLWASRRLSRPVKWTATRKEHLMVDAHGRDHQTLARAAFSKHGKITGLWVDTKANLGAYLSTFGPAVPTYLYATLLSGAYAIPAIYCRVKAYYTNTAPVDAYRGAGRPEACYVLERMMSKAAKQLGLSPVDIRSMNFVTEYPYQTPVAVMYDSGCYPELMKEALEKSDYAGFAARKEASKARGKIRGIGMSSFIEACGIAPSKLVGQLGARAGLWEHAQVHIDATGAVEVRTGTHPHGQSGETTIAQVVSDKLGVPFEQIRVVHGDTHLVDYGMGTYGSRGTAVGIPPVLMSCDKILEKAKKIAKFMLEVGDDDLHFEQGAFHVKGTDKKVMLGEIAFAASVPHNFPEDLEPLLSADAAFDPTNFVYPGGVHICEVEIDEQTGDIQVVKYTAVDDFGTIINPTVVEGQVHGGVMQGIGQALYEEVVYSDEGQLLTDSLESYKLPRAHDGLNISSSYVQSAPTSTNPIGAKGCGEAGAIASPPAVMNAVIDALGTDAIEMPATPAKVWNILQSSTVK